MVVIGFPQRRVHNYLVTLIVVTHLFSAISFTGGGGVQILHVIFETSVPGGTFIMGVQISRDSLRCRLLHLGNDAMEPVIILYIASLTGAMI